MQLYHHQQIQVRRRGISRRSFLHGISASAVAAGTMNLRDLMSLQAAELRKQGRAMILLWMAGGPSQFETFDPKPNHNNGGPTRAIKTAVPGIEIAEGWEQTAKVMKDITLIRSMTNKEGSHPRASYQMHTGYIPSGSVKHPSLGSNIAKQLADPEFDLPSVVCVGRNSPAGAGFLGVDYEPFVVRSAGQLPENVATTVVKPRYKRRLGLLGQLEDQFAKRGGEVVVKNHKQLYGKSSKLVLSPQVKTFEFSNEKRELIDRYGDSDFGRGCLLARRLVEAGSTFVEVVSSGGNGVRNWDTHQDIFDNVATLASQVDPATATLITDLKDRGMLDKTIVVWMGEFGRTPRINPRTGRDHYPSVFNAAVAGGGTRGGQVIGASTNGGDAVAKRPVTPDDLFCSVCKSLNVNARAENISPLGRPMRIVDKGEVVDELFS